MDTDINQQIGHRFRELRKAMGLSLRDVSEKMDLSFTYLGDLERGDKPWKFQQIVQLAEIYNVPPSLITDPRIPIEHVQLIGSIVGELSDESEEMLQAYLRMLQVRK